MFYSRRITCDDWQLRIEHIWIVFHSFQNWKTELAGYSFYVFVKRFLKNPSSGEQVVFTCISWLGTFRNCTACKKVLQQDG